MDKTKFTLGEFSFPVFFLQKTRQNPKNLDVFPKVNNRKTPKILQKSLNIIKILKNL
jgi:hypothetical protein